jgi:hypothetical protein
MATWKKIILSGSNAELGSLKITGVTSGSIFSGSFVGDGSGITGISSAPSYQIKGNDGSTVTFNPSTNTQLFTTSSQHGFSFGVSGTAEKTITLTTPQGLRTTDSPTFNNLTISGDLNVLGSVVELQVTNLNVEDKFILLNSGSTTGDAGIIASSGSVGQGVALGWDNSADRWGVQQVTKLASNAVTLAPEAYLSYVIDVDGGLTDLINYRRNGNIKIESGDVFIYS